MSVHRDLVDIYRRVLGGSDVPRYHTDAFRAPIKIGYYSNCDDLKVVIDVFGVLAEHRNNPVAIDRAAKLIAECYTKDGACIPINSDVVSLIRAIARAENGDMLEILEKMTSSCAMNDSDIVGQFVDMVIDMYRNQILTVAQTYRLLVNAVLDRRIDYYAFCSLMDFSFEVTAVQGDIDYDDLAKLMLRVFDVGEQEMLYLHNHFVCVTRLVCLIRTSDIRDNVPYATKLTRYVKAQTEGNPWDYHALCTFASGMSQDNVAWKEFLDVASAKATAAKKRQRAQMHANRLSAAQ